MSDSTTRRVRKVKSHATSLLVPQSRLDSATPSRSFVLRWCPHASQLPLHLRPRFRATFSPALLESIHTPHVPDLETKSSFFDDDNVDVNRCFFSSMHHNCVIRQVALGTSMGYISRFYPSCICLSVSPHLNKSDFWHLKLVDMMPLYNIQVAEFFFKISIGREEVEILYCYTKCIYFTIGLE